ncbi:MAG: (2Fe-2S)-binding protein [candidate division KSB1 bacterium]|jgi:aerobic-type carbon monoxide dehydrogenase small subunit (CoxS/CutS family)|nr:(2Fe-2S)-binding protein [candidate division KSB1 bacterium]
MAKKSNKGVSRRKFIQGIGTGVIGSAVLPAALSSREQEDGSGTPRHQGQQLVSLNVNGHPVRKLIPPEMTLAEFIRETLSLTGTKIACNSGQCGACTVILDGRAVYSCHMLALDAHGKSVQTIEGMLDGEELHPVQEAFVEKDGYQCGFCTPGQVLTAQSLLNRNPNPTAEQVKAGMSGNLCRCSAYPKIVDSVLAAADKILK